MQLRNGLSWWRRVAPIAFIGALGLGALSVHAARSWLVVPLPSPSPAAHASEAEIRQGPLAAFALPASERMRFDGRVLDRLEAGSYVYLRVERASGEPVWVVTLRSSEGARPDVQRASVVAIGYAPHFDSKRLGRSFEGLYFAVVRPS